jgi:hypothetical protein
VKRPAPGFYYHGWINSQFELEVPHMPTQCRGHGTKQSVPPKLKRSTTHAFRLLTKENQLGSGAMNGRMSSSEVRYLPVIDQAKPAGPLVNS